MARPTNPYRPGFAQTPVVLAGRVEVLDGAREALEVAAYDGRTPRPLVLVGPRGLGKTVTLHEIANLAAKQLSWPHVHVETTSGAGLLNQLSTRLEHAAQLLAGHDPTPRRRRARISGGKVEARALGIGGAIELEATPAPTNEGAAVELPRALRRATEAAVTRGAGVLVTLDELQVADAGELSILGAALQESAAQGWPLVVAIAALPSLRTNRGAQKMPTYLERAEWHELGVLPLADATEALVEPARQAGRPMTDDAARILLDLSGGYPYAIQVAGHYAWRASHGGDQITSIHATDAKPRIVRDLEQLFAGRWDDASPREREYLVAMAAAALAKTSGPRGGDVAAQLNATSTAVSYLRDRLIKKGTIYSDATGRLHFVTPGMGEWLRASWDAGTAGPQ